MPPRRLILALDQDNFYVGVARALHPALHGLPVGITQKSLLATVSYQARALGLTKLQNIREATDVVHALGGRVVTPADLQHPDPPPPPPPVLVLVSGEDLTPYRRASRAVSWIVNTLLGVGPAPHPHRLPAPLSATSPPAPAATHRKRKREREGYDDPAARNPPRGAAGASPLSETHIDPPLPPPPPSAPGCEKLGLDEVFVDITALVDAHLASPAITNDRGETFFRLPDSAVNVLSLPNTLRQSSSSPPNDRPLECGFWYPQTLAGHPLPHPPTATPPARTLVVASHLCAFLRRTIWEKTGLTSSGGVAGSKMLAKLISGAKKPNGQSFWVDDEDGHDGSALARAQDQSRPGFKSLQDYLDPLPLSALPGFGTHVISSLMTALPPSPSADSLPKSKEITVHHIRTSLPLSVFTRLFPGPQATTLYNLLHGYDPSPVRPTPEYPLQLSVEDSYAATLTRPLRVILAQMLQLVKKLLDRLEEELIGSASERYSHGITFTDPPPSTAKTRPTWQRYPTQFRVTLRTFTNTHSQSAPMPAFIFDTRVPTADRAERVMRTVGKRLCYGLLPGKIETEAQSFEVYVINVAATHLSLSAPPPSIDSLPSSRRRPAFDLSFIAALPPEMRNELIEEYRIPREDVRRIMAEQQNEVIEITDSDDESSSGPRAVPGSIPRLESEPCESSAIRCVEDREENSSEVVGDEDHCRLCGAQVFSFAAQAHARWHAQQE